MAFYNPHTVSTFLNTSLYFFYSVLEPSVWWCKCHTEDWAHKVTSAFEKPRVSAFTPVGWKEQPPWLRMDIAFIRTGVRLSDLQHYKEWAHDYNPDIPHNSGVSKLLSHPVPPEEANTDNWRKPFSCEIWAKDWWSILLTSSATSTALWSQHHSKRVQPDTRADLDWYHCHHWVSQLAHLALKPVPPKLPH